MSTKHKAAFLSNSPDKIEKVYAKGRKERIAQITDLYPVVVSDDNFDDHVDDLKDLEVIFSTWGMLVLSDEQLDKLPSLKALFYAAGSVKYFAQSLIERKITVMSGWAANAVPVAEFTLAQILLSCKGYFRNVSDYKSPERRRKGEVFRGHGNLGETVAVIGAGMVGRKLIELLRNFALKVIVHDPFLSDEEATKLGVSKVSLEEAFEQGYVVSNHVPDLPGTKNMIDGHLFERMRDNTTFINTARGATVVEDDLIRVFKERPTLTALLDVTKPEPPEDGSKLYNMSNVHLTSHIAGPSKSDEIVRTADYCIDEFLAWEQGKPMRFALNLEMLEKMA